MSATLEAREPVARYLATPPLLQHFDRVAQAPGGIARLRELILTLAVQGKLVPQDPTDEPASVLLERIRAEKARLVKEGKIRKEKPLAAITEKEKPFALPPGWEWARLAQVSSRVQYGFTASASPEIDSPKLLRITDIQNDCVNWNTVPGVIASNSELADYFLEAGDLLIARTGGTIGKSFLVKEAPVASVFASYLIRISPIFFLQPEYLKVFASSGSYWKQLFAKSMGTGQPNVNGTALGHLVMPLPPLAEQSRIVTRVEELMALCDTLEETGRLAAVQHERLTGALFDALANSATAEEATENWQRIAPHFDLLLDRTSTVDRLEQTILQLAVRGRLVPQNPADEPAITLLQKIRNEKDRLIAAGQLKRDKPLPPISEEEKRFELPQLWEWVRLGQVIELVSGQHLLPNEYSENLDLAIPYLTGPAEFGPMYPQPTRSTNERRAIATNEDILITVKGSGVGKLNLVAIEELAISRQLMAIRPIIVGHDFLFLALSVLGGSFLEKSVGIAIPGISRIDVTEAVVALPPIAEQSRIVARVAELRALCAQLRQRIATTAQIQSRLAEALVDDLG